MMVLSLQRQGPWGLSQPHLTFWGWPGCHSQSQRWGTYGAPVLLCRVSTGVFENEHWTLEAMASATVYPPASTVMVSFHPLLGLLGFPRREAIRLIMGEGEEALRALFCLAGSSLFEMSGTYCSLTSLPWRVASSSGVGSLLCSSPVGFRREASTMSSPPRAIRGVMHFWS